MTPRDALAAALHEGWQDDCYGPYNEASHTDWILSALAAQGWVLVLAAPDPAPWEPLPQYPLSPADKARLSPAPDPAPLDVAAERTRIVAAVEGLTTHTVSGYEWECVNCNWSDAAKDDVDANGTVCIHGELGDVAIGRAAVLRLIAGDKP